MMKDKIYDKIKGALYGVAIGDALGGPLEFMSAEEITDKHGLVTEMIGGGWLDLEPGETTDDTAMTLCVAEGILEKPNDPFDAIGKRFIEWYKTRPKDIGITCSQSIVNAMRNGGDWIEAANKTQAAAVYPVDGNGSLMRTIYTALYYPNEADREAFTWTVAAMTHAGALGKVICIEYAELINSLLYDLPCKTPSYKAGTSPTGYVLDTYCNALEAVQNNGTFETSLIDAVNRGGDADTIGAVAGGIAGAMYGYTAIPVRWIEALDEKLKEKLDGLAEAAYEEQKKGKINHEEN